MTLKNLTRPDLADAVLREIGLSHIESADLVDSVFNHISNAVVGGDDVKLTGFGTFTVREKAARMGRNPKTNEPAQIDARRVLTFRPSAMLKARLEQIHEA